MAAVEFASSALYVAGMYCVYVRLRKAIEERGLYRALSSVSQYTLRGLV